MKETDVILSRRVTEAKNLMKQMTEHEIRPCSQAEPRNEKSLECASYAGALVVSSHA
jgi:hypothetical protein